MLNSVVDGFLVDEFMIFGYFSETILEENDDLRKVIAQPSEAKQEKLSPGIESNDSARNGRGDLRLDVILHAWRNACVFKYSRSEYEENVTQISK